MKNTPVFVEICQNDITGRPTSSACKITFMQHFKPLLTLESKNPSGVPVNTCNAIKIHGNVIPYLGFESHQPNKAWNRMPVHEAVAEDLMNVLRKSRAWHVEGGKNEITLAFKRDQAISLNLNLKTENA